MNLTNSKGVTALIFTNPFDLNDYERLEVPYEALSVTQLIEGVNPELDLLVTVNGVEVSPERFGEVIPWAGSIVTIFVVPAGGDTSTKDILRMVAVIIVAVATMQLYSIGYYWTAAAVAVGGNLLINTVLPYEMPNTDASMGMDDSPSYGIDGPKNTSREGIPVPLTFGKNRIAGNIIALFTENIGSNQYLNMLLNLGEGEQAGYSDVLLNDVEADVFSAEIEYRSGTADQALIPNFETAREVRTFGYTFAKYEETLTFTTINEVSRIRLGVNVPQLYVERDNELGYGHVKMLILMRRVGQEEWRLFQTGIPLDYSSSGLNSSMWRGVFLNPIEQIIDGKKVKAIPDVNDYDNFSIDYVYQDGDGGYDGSDSREQERDNWDWNGSSGSYERIGKVKARNKATGEYEIVGEWFGQSTSVTRPEGAYYDVGSGNHQMVSKHLSPKRFNLISAQMPPGQYEVKIVRYHPVVNKTNGTGENPTAWVLTEIDEILPFGVNYRHTALLAMRVQVTDQFQQIPNVTVISHGLLLDVYDSETETWSRGASDNPAWIAYNCYTNQRWGAGYEAERMDLPAFVAWAKDCEANGWKFNGTFDTAGSLHDQTKNIFKVGHARLVMLGNLFSVSVIKDKRPSMMFNTSNIIKGSLELNWTSDDDRANEVDVIYYDAENGYRRSEFKVYDQEAFERGDKSKPASITLHGVTNYEQAYKEGIFALNMNKIAQSVKFKSTLEGKDVQVGEVVLVQHNMPRWSEGGKLDSGSTLRTLVLDRKVQLGDGQHEILIQYPSLRLADAVVERASEDRLYLTTDVGMASSVIVGGKEYIVIGQLTARSLKLDRTIAATVGETVQVYAKDVIQSRKIAELNGEFSEVTIHPAEPSLPMPPGRFSWSIGKMSLVSKPFLVTEVRTEDPYEYEISAMEFIPSLLQSEPVSDIPDFTFNPASKPESVVNIHTIVEKQGRASMQQNVLTSSWGYRDSNLYQRADVYVSVDGGDLYLAQQGARNQFQMLVKFGQKVKIVIAANNGQATQSLGEAAFDTITITTTDKPVKPTSLTVEVIADTVDIKWLPATNPTGETIIAEYTVYRAAGEGAVWPGDYVQVDKVIGLHYIDPEVTVSTRYSYAVLATNIFGENSEAVFGTIVTPEKFNLKAREGVETQFFKGPAETNIEEAGNPTTHPELWTSDSSPDYKFQATRYYKDNEFGAWNVSYIVRKEVNVVVQYSLDGNAPWKDEYSAFDMYMRQSSDNGVTWGPALRIVGENGSDGDYIDYIFFDAEAEPETPIGPNPAGWSDAPVGSVIWMSKAKRRASGELLESWTRPVRLTGPAGVPSATYWLVRSETVVKRNPDGTYDIPSITVTGKYQTGSNPVSDFLGRFKIFTRVGQSPWELVYNSIQSESTHTMSVPAGIDAIKFQLLDASLNVVDEETTVIIEEGAVYDIRIESSRGLIFRPGMGSETILKARVFKNGFEITDELPASRFKWRRVSLNPKPAPNDDATWDNAYKTGYKQVLVTVDDVDSKATFYCDLLI